LAYPNQLAVALVVVLLLVAERVVECRLLEIQGVVAGDTPEIVEASDPIASWNMATQQPQYQVNQFGQPVNQFGQPIMMQQVMPQQFLGYPQQQRPVFPTVGGQQPVQQQVALQQPMQPQVGWGMPKFNKL
jgi:hypothetical protein